MLIEVHACALQITQELREYAQQHQMDESEALQVGCSPLCHPPVSVGFDTWQLTYGLLADMPS